MALTHWLKLQGGDEWHIEKIGKIIYLKQRHTKKPVKAWLIGNVK